ncbi:MAG: phosphoglycerate kinase [Candidatus Marinimicrobia bacterium]|nr:phosphoglycerate kinase [Candidatus Neomarinimicrobiota bacterium]
MLNTLNSYDLKYKRVLIRVDFNVPLKNGVVTDDFRIRAAVPTIQYCLNSGASVVLMSHLGRPNGEVIPELSLMPVGETLADLLEKSIKFSHDCVSEDARDVSLGLSSGEVHLLENLRFHQEETTNDLNFSTLLAKHGSIYINDAFGTAHRAHASNVGVTAHFSQRGIGFLVEKEIKFLKEVINRPHRPLVVILGGAKVGSKLSLINRFLDEADQIVIGGGMAFTFLQAMGKRVGGSLVDTTMLGTANKIIETAVSKKIELLFPSDVVCAAALDKPEPSALFNVDEIPDNQMGLDIGVETIRKFESVIAKANTIIWNGPMGVFELPGFDTGTRIIAEAIAQVTSNGGTSVVGGGDSAAAVKNYNLMDKMSHVSTGGGASLELLSGVSLPALIVLER